jgi:hypothetical protein
MTHSGHAGVEVFGGAVWPFVLPSVLFVTHGDAGTVLVFLRHLLPGAANAAARERSWTGQEAGPYKEA